MKRGRRGRRVDVAQTNLRCRGRPAGGGGEPPVRRVNRPAGERMILEENRFIEWLLVTRIMRQLTETEMETYRRPFREPGEGRRPTLTWPRQLPIAGEPADVVEIVRANRAWLEASSVPKLFISSMRSTRMKGTLRTKAL